MNVRQRNERVVATAEVRDLAHDGRGVAQCDGKTVFIDDALPGERVEWLRTKRGRNFDEGKLVAVLEPSPHRVTPRCPHFGVCGGCVLQHLAPASQIEFKQRQLSEALARIGSVHPEMLLPPLQADVWSYRRRARLSARWVPKKGRVVVGFRERSTTYIADLQQCDVLREPVGRLIEPLSKLFSTLSIRQRLPQVEVSVTDRVVALVIRILEPLTAADTAALRDSARQQSVEIYLQPGGYDTVQPLEATATALEYALPEFDVTLRFEPTDFIQVNAALNERMIARALELLAPTPNDRVLDLFCGLGNFSLPLARRAAHVTGVEGDAGLIARARANAQRNGIENAEFVVANLAQERLEEATWAQQRYDAILLDPPRAGAREVLHVVGRSGARRVVYVSCHPGSLARDAGILVQEFGFRLRAAGVMDMFPHTAHVESIAVFERGT